VTWTGSTVSLTGSGELDDDTALAIAEVRSGKDGVAIKAVDRIAALTLPTPGRPQLQVRGRRAVLWRSGRRRKDRSRPRPCAHGAPLILRRVNEAGGALKFGTEARSAWSK
jgi:hypothetical protein